MARAGVSKWEVRMGHVTRLSHHSTSTDSDRPNSELTLFDRVAHLLDRVDYKLAESSADREAIFRLRYQAYMRDGGIRANSSLTFSDAYDELGKVFLFGVYVDGELASSIRIHVASGQHPEFPTLDVFPDILQPEIDAGKVIVDSTRFVTDERLSRIHRTLPYVTLRVGGIAAHHFHTDHLLAAVRPEHQAFYRRVFRHRLVGGPRSYPGLAKPVSLMMADYQKHVEDVHRRYPFFRSSLFERRMLLEREHAAPAHQSPELQGDGRPFAEWEAPRLAG